MFILDETNTKVRILKKDGFTVWIPKHFLLKEITGTQEPEVTSILSALMILMGKLNVALTESEQEKVSQAISLARNLIDKKKVAKGK